jgi:hypothetical protein
LAASFISWGGGRQKYDAETAKWRLLPKSRWQNPPHRHFFLASAEEKSWHPADMK